MRHAATTSQLPQYPVPSLQAPETKPIGAQTLEIERYALNCFDEQAFSFAHMLQLIRVVDFY